MPYLRDRRHRLLGFPPFSPGAPFSPGGRRWAPSLPQSRLRSARDLLTPNVEQLADCPGPGMRKTATSVRVFRPNSNAYKHSGARSLTNTEPFGVGWVPTIIAANISFPNAQKKIAGHVLQIPIEHAR
ncbi:hypothetical protein HYPSUDRAFT_40782 [Hypholoma sublateritium FD-334 SS-4]|uniref:Uncharacterized protein n=1 Tax=Hypholoma sublateritium (strain FD-334 SS-4) TaxID=945553 RepID=A0A0D2NV75_HYPSF|nr:hypothetical protein HYPSUDRAFT_40782 [Hypholoma sublateritium FD-334 SS-4]